MIVLEFLEHYRHEIVITCEKMGKNGRRHIERNFLERMSFSPLHPHYSHRNQQTALSYCKMFGLNVHEKNTPKITKRISFEQNYWTIFCLYAAINHGSDKQVSRAVKARRDLPIHFLSFSKYKCVNFTFVLNCKFRVIDVVLNAEVTLSQAKSLIAKISATNAYESMKTDTIRADIRSHILNQM